MKKFNVFDPILVRSNHMSEWTADFYDRFNSKHKQHYAISGVLVGDDNILPYNEETKHLHNTIGEFTEWKPKKGEPVLVKDRCDATWTIRIFLRMQGDRFICTCDTSVIDSTSGTEWDQAKPYINPFEE